MTTTVAGGGRASAARGWLVIAGIVGALLLIGALTLDRRTDVDYDTRSTGPSGTRAMVELLESYGATVEVVDDFGAGSEADVAIAFRDVIPSSSTEAVRQWLRRNHTLVMADPRSDLTPESDTVQSQEFAATIERGRCDIDALAEVARLQLGTQTASRRRFVDKGDKPVCFAENGEAFIIEQREGSGQVIGVASPSVFTNDRLGDVDNAVLVTALLAPRPGTRVAVLTDAAFAEGDPEATDMMGSLRNIIGPGVRFFLFQLAVAMGLYALARSRRLGRPLSEPQPVQIAGSELVGATGNLLQQRRDPDRAASILRADLRRVLAERLGLSPDQPPAALVEALSARTGLSRDEAAALVEERPVGDNAGLVELAHRIDVVREEVLHGHTP